MIYRLATAAVTALALTACGQPDVVPVNVPTSSEGVRIGYVNTDTILSNYSYLAEQSNILQQREQDASAELERKVRKFQGQVESFQRRAQGGNLTPKAIENEQRVLAQREQELQGEQQRLAAEFQGEGLRLQNELTTVLKREVDAIQASDGYDYILSYGANSPVLSVNSAYDITGAVLTRMNDSGASAALDTIAVEE